MNSERTSVIISNFNTAAILEECLSNLREVNSSLEVIVVDNASSDGSAEMVRDKFPQVILLTPGKNLGLSASYNLGLTKASGAMLLFLGSDAFPEEGTIAGVADYLTTHPEVGLATCKLILRDGSLDRDAHRGFPTPWTALTHFLSLDRIFNGSHLFDRYFLGYEDTNQPHEIDLCISHFMLVRKEVFDKIGGFDEDFFVYGEDVDFCYRVKEAGWKIMYLPQWQATHYKGASVGVRKETADITTATKETKRRMSQESTTAMRLFYQKHYANKYPRILTLLVFLLIGYKKRIRTLRFR